MAIGKIDLYFVIISLAVSLVLTGCKQAERTTQSYTLTAGSVDAHPDPLWGEQYPYTPPEPSGKPFDPTDGAGVQKFADRLMGRRIADFEMLDWDSLRDGPEVLDFFPEPQAGSDPGMCVVRPYQVAGSGLRGRDVRVHSQKWGPPVYTIAGSLAPIQGTPSAEYRARLSKACSERTDMDMWFNAQPKMAYLGASLADRVVAEARRAGALPFELRCTPFPADVPYSPSCAEDVRRVTATLNPRAILEIGSCFDKSELDCVSVELAKAPVRSHKIGDRWTLDITLDHDKSQIKAVDLTDTQLIID